jgi:hypothetical protein
MAVRLIDRQGEAWVPEEELAPSRTMEEPEHAWRWCWQPHLNAHAWCPPPPPGPPPGWQQPLGPPPPTHGEVLVCEPEEEPEPQERENRMAWRWSLSEGALVWCPGPPPGPPPVYTAHPPTGTPPTPQWQGKRRRHEVHVQQH